MHLFSPTCHRGQGRSIQRVTHDHDDYITESDDGVTDLLDGDGEADPRHLYLTVLEGCDICILPVKMPGARWWSSHPMVVTRVCLPLWSPLL